jgi:chemotaxis protein CheZ
MECAETLMAADASDPAAYKALVDEKMLLIFEACSFQDITGQRIARVVEALQHIEERVARFATAMQAKDLDGFLTQNERESAERKERLLLHGPQDKDRLAAHGQIRGVAPATPPRLRGGGERSEPGGISQSEIPIC